ncbi:MAG: DUF6159 family protein [Betaproteobacteria bacterium]
MFDRLSRSWELVKGSWTVLQQDKELLVFPLISSIAMLAVVACFALPLIGMGGLDGLSRNFDGDLSVAQYAIAFLFYVVQYFVIFYFNAALVGAVMIRLDGGDPTLGDGLAVASSKLWNILGYALIAATVGMILRAIQERVGFIGKIIVGLLGTGWSIATYLVVPVLVTRDVGPVEAVKESAIMLKRTWGENVIGQAGIGFAFGLIQLAIILTGIAIIVLAAMAKSIALVIAAVVVLVIAVLSTMLVHSALSGIYAAALYRFASDEKSTGAFRPEVLQSAFQPK